LSSKTVEWDLTKIYRKLNIGSRAELARKFALRQIVPADAVVPPHKTRRHPPTGAEHQPG